MTRNQQLARMFFAICMISLGVLALVYGHLGLAWYSVPAWVPLRQVVTYASAVILLGTGAGLLFNPASAISTKILLSYLAMWLLLRVPTLARDPLTEVNWQNAGELAVLVAGALVLYGWLGNAGEGSTRALATAKSGQRTIKILFAFALIAFGLSHFAYANQTAGLVPGWLPFHMGWTYLTGAGHTAAGLGVLFSVFPRLAAAMEAAMLSVFTILVWIPIILAGPTNVPTWTELIISAAITAGAWLVEESLATRAFPKPGG